MRGWDNSSSAHFALFDCFFVIPAQKSAGFERLPWECQQESLASDEGGRDNQETE
jgi:hypothetical protein